MAPSKAPLVFPIHQQWQARDQAKEDSQPLSGDQNDQAVSWAALIIYTQYSMNDMAKDFSS